MMKDLKELCNKIQMPQEVTNIILNDGCMAQDSNIKVSMKKLFDKRTWEEGLAELKQDIGEDADGFGILACELWCALESFEIYEKHGISEQIYVDTMKCFSRFVEEHKESYGRYGFDREWWVPRQISGLLFRIGELEYELVEENGHSDGLKPAEEETDSAVCEQAQEDEQKERRSDNGGRCIHLHIPSDAVLTPERIEKSLKMARELIAEKFPEYAAAKIMCDSWLLSPALKEVLPPSSHILGFQKYFEIKSLGADEGEYMIWVFKRSDLPPEEWPENTSLQRNLKNYILSGGKVMAATGILKD